MRIFGGKKAQGGEKKVGGRKKKADRFVFLGYPRGERAKRKEKKRELTPGTLTYIRGGNPFARRKSVPPKKGGAPQ